MTRRALFAAALATLAAILAITPWALADRLEDTFALPLDHPAIQYAAPTPNDPIARLNQKLATGKTRLDFAPNGWGYLPALLKELGVNIDSQGLVFSKTSVHADHISPLTPRAIYFSDDVSVGYVQNADLELSALDSRQGVIFYTMDPEKSDQPRLVRRDDCLLCHQGPVTLAIPGLMISSVRPRTKDLEDLHGTAFMTDHRIPLAERWGGWYVTGTTGAQVHLGNNLNLVNPVQREEVPGLGLQNLTSLAKLFDTSKYLAPTSDLVALMTLEHQVRMTNLLIRVGWAARIAEYDKKTNDEETRKDLDLGIDKLVTYMLFADEEPLHGPVAGVSTFTKTFPEQGPRDHQSRSLRDFDLQKRLFKYPLSYMIYSPAFDALPGRAREIIYQKLYDVLSNKNQSADFAAISASDRASVLAILRDTKPDLPAYWRASVKQ